MLNPVLNDMIRSWVIVLMFLIGGSANAAPGFQTRKLKDHQGVEFEYVVFVPHDLKSNAKPPVMLFLHGAGAIGQGPAAPDRIGVCKIIREREKTFPFVVVIPHAEKRERNLIETWYPAMTEGKRAIAALDSTLKEFNGDPKRVYLTGMSMGGFGTWAMAQTYPKKWAAIAPICGGGLPEWASAIKDIPCWAFHGDQDSTVPVDRTRQMIDALKKAGASPKYTEFPGVGHNCWDKAYATDGLFDWFSKQTSK